MKNFKTITGLAGLVVSSFLLLAGCDNKSEIKNETINDTPKTIKVGVVPGPYKEILEKYLQPIVVKQGHSLQFVEFTDWIQPDSALDVGDIDANLFQHQSYLNGVVANQKYKLSSVVNFPTLGIFVFSDKYKSLDEIQENAKVGIPNDPVNLARALRVARDLNLITFSQESDEQKASVADIKDNYKNLEFIPMEAAQLPRSLDSIEVAFVPGNYSYAAKLDFNKALAKEDVKEPIKLVIAVQDHRVNSVGEYLKQAVLNPEFRKGVDSDPVFKNFSKPAWWNN